MLKMGLKGAKYSTKNRAENSPESEGKMNKILIRTEALKGLRKDEKELCGAKLHHTSLCQGYVKKSTPPTAVPYKGRFGTGWTIKSHNAQSSRYCFISYWILEGEK